MSEPTPVTTSIIVTDSVSTCNVQFTWKSAPGMVIQFMIGTYQASKPLVARLMRSVTEMRNAPKVMRVANQPVMRSPVCRLLVTIPRPKRPLNNSPARGRYKINGASENVFIRAPQDNYELGITN